MNELFQQLIQRAQADPSVMNRPLSEIPGAKIGMMPILPRLGIMEKVRKILGGTKTPPTPSVPVDPTISKNAPTLGERLPEYTPMGGEELINANRTNPSVIEKVYQKILEKGGR